MNNHRLIDNLSKAILEYMGGRAYRPLTGQALFKALSLPKEHEEIFQKALTRLMMKGEIDVTKGLFSIPGYDAPEKIEGKIKVHPRGFGFLKVGEKEVFIPKSNMGDCVDGDTVEVEVIDTGHPKGPEGKVISIAKRGRKMLFGTVYVANNEGTYMHASLLGEDRPVKVTGGKLAIGDRIGVQVTKWGNKRSYTQGEFVEKFGVIDDPLSDIQAAAHEFEIATKFSKEALDEARAFGKEVKKEKGREDFTKLETFTIDPETAKDYDDALSIQKEQEGGYTLWVHIADVSHYVKGGSKLDFEAKKRCNSTYLPGTCLPMLPEELSNELCSLKEGVLRNTCTVKIRFDKTGAEIKTEIVRGQIKSAKRFTYEEAKEILDGKKKSPHKKALEEMVELCLLLKKKRAERGSIDFSLPETVLLVDKQGIPTGTKVVEYDITHQLVEEFALKANEAVATHLDRKGIPSLYRIHEEPEEETLEEFYGLARSLGFKLSEKPSKEELQELFFEAKESPFSRQLSIAYIRSMQLAFYSRENVGHYGLSLTHYSHFTSPIRRYSDLLVHRALFDAPPTEEEVEEVGQLCSEKERISFSAEMSVKLLKKLRYMQKKFLEDPEQLFDATVTKVKPFGLTFEENELALEGFLPISEIGNDYFIYNERTQTLQGRHTGISFKVGSALKLRLQAVDLIFKEAKWELYQNHSSKKKMSSRSRAKSSGRPSSRKSRKKHR